MMPLAGWEGPYCVADGVFRYSKSISWIRLFIDVQGGDLFGGTCAARSNFEVECEDGQWMRFETDLAMTPAGEPVMRLYGCTTWDVVYHRIGDGRSIEEKIENIEDLAAYLESCFP